MAELKSRLRADMKEAMKAREAERLGVIRMALAAISTEEVAGSEAKELSEAEELRVITREVRKRKESAEAYTDGGRPELAEKELAEAEILNQYLPQPLTDDELQQLVDQAVAGYAAEHGEAPTMKQMGQLVKAVNEQAAGRAEGKTVAAKVKAALS
ncbi:GatB/YqeY domain-containing protein [Enemella sp. A6]|uniref:GatB/YqeY domain-containing protein n=1 Tax=Enemella sp. A6 TaxID=3440152 RepID=UPI003EC0D168